MGFGLLGISLNNNDDFDQVDSSSIGDGDKSKPKEFIIKKQIQRNPSNAHIYSKNLSNINIYNINNAGGTENNRLDENSTSSNQNSQIQHQQQQQPYFNTFNQQKVQQQIGVVQKQQQQNQQQQQQQQFRVSQQQWIKPSRQMSKRQQIRNQHSVKENQATRNQQSQFQQEGGQQFYNSNQSMNPYVQQNQNAGQYGISVQKPSTFKRQVTQNQDNQIYQQQHQQSNYAENPSSIKIQQKRVARNTVYGVSFMDSAKQNQALANTEYEQMSKAGSRASALRPYHRQLKQSIGGTNQIPALSSNQNNPSTFQQSQINQQQQQQYGARPSESQQRVRIHRLNSAMEDVDGVINKQGIPGMMHQNEEFTQMNRRLIHQSQSSSNFPQPRAFTNANSNQPNIVYANFSAGQQELNNGSSMIQNDQAFRISINKEDKVKNHLTKEVNPNMNLMFYDFNDYGQSSKTTSANQPLASQSQSRPQQQPIGDRLPSRQNQTRGSRRGMRDSQSKFYEQISNMNSDFSQRLGSPFPNFQKRAKVILPSIQLPNGSQQSQIGGNILSQGSKAGISYHNIHHKQQNSNHSPKRNASIGIVMEMINEEDF